jgi:hypothetical protein
LVVIVDLVAIAIEIFANNRTAAVVAGGWKSGWWTLGKKRY